MTRNPTHARNNHSGRERYDNREEHPSSGINKQIQDRISAECGSIAMLNALDRAIQNHARKHGYTFDQSRLLCANSTERMA